MRFQKSSPTPPFGGRDRIVVFIFLGALAIFFAVQVGTKPEFWKAIRKKPGAPDDPTALRDNENLFATQTPGGASIPDAPPLPVTIEENSELAIPPTALKPVRDNTMGIRKDEVPAYFATLKYAHDHSQQLQNTASRRVPYTMLMAEPWLYRGGKPISIKGRLRGLRRRTAGQNDVGIRQLYDAWVFTDDSGSNPIHVVCLGIPPNIPMPELGQQDVYRVDPPEISLNGYFFKTQGYQSNGDGSDPISLHTAPLVLASVLNHVPAVQTETRDLASEMVPWLWWFAIGVAVVLGMVLWNFAISDWSFRHTRAHGLLQAPGITPDFHGIAAQSTHEMLYELSRDGFAQDYLREPSADLPVDSFGTRDPIA